MDDLDIKKKLEENCKDDKNLAKFLKELFSYELEGTRHNYKKDYDKMIEKYSNSGD
ncbi:MAG: hypothetical protein FWH54_00275 [Methanobrevibacter sp.]|nr:hypothetical protein [Methanobrevibacter sp.]